MLEWRTTASSNIHQKSVGVLQNLTYEGIMSIKTGVFYAFGFLFSQVFVLRVFFFVCLFFQNIVSRDIDVSFAIFREGKFHCKWGWDGVRLKVRLSVLYVRL